MRLIQLENGFVNPDAVCIVEACDRADRENGYQTEVTLTNGKRLYMASPSEVLLVLEGRAKP